MPVLVPRQAVADTELGLIELVGPAPVARLPVQGSVVVGRADRQVIIGHQPGQIGIARAQLEGDRVVAVIDQILDIGQQRLGRGFRILARW